MAFVIRRVLHSLIVLFLVSLVVFFVIRLRGDPVMQFIPPNATPSQIIALRHVYGFDRPVYVQYGEFLARLVRGDFGLSFRYRTAAFPLVIERLPVTIRLTTWALAAALAVSFPLGIVSAVRPNSLADFFATGVSVVGRAVPDYWLGIMLMLVFAVWLGWLPVSGFGTLQHMILPAATLGVSLATTLTRIIRSSMLEAIHQDHITTARSKGLSESTVLYKHALRNALIPITTILGVQTAWLLGGVTVIEQVFSVPGMGQLMIRAVMQNDMAVIQAGVFIFALIVIVINLSVDVLYTMINPKIRYS